MNLCNNLTCLEVFHCNSYFEKVFDKSVYLETLRCSQKKNVTYEKYKLHISLIYNLGRKYTFFNYITIPYSNTHICIHTATHI